MAYPIQNYMDTIASNKRFMQTLTTLFVLLSVFIALKAVNEIKNNKYIGAGITPGNTITVSGTGEVSAVPDIATETVTIQSEGKTQKEAQEPVSVKEGKVLAFLKSVGVADKDIKTESNSVYPKYTAGPQIECFRYPCPPVNQVISGYTATETISIKIRNVDDTGKIVQGLSEIGVELSGPNFSIDDEDGLKAEARQKAIADAKVKAASLEKDLGISLGRIVSFNEDGGGYPVYYGKAMMSADSVGSAAPAPTLPTGENKITSNVSITYEIK